MAEEETKQGHQPENEQCSGNEVRPITMIWQVNNQAGNKILYPK